MKGEYRRNNRKEKSSINVNIHMDEHEINNESLRCLFECLERIEEGMTLISNEIVQLRASIDEVETNVQALIDRGGVDQTENVAAIAAERARIDAISTKIGDILTAPSGEEPPTDSTTL